MHETGPVVADVFPDRVGRGDVQDPGHLGIEFTGFEGAIPRAVEHGPETIGSEQLSQTGKVLRIQRDNARPSEARCLLWPNADHLAWIARLEVAQGVESGHTGD